MDCKRKESNCRKGKGNHPGQRPKESIMIKESRIILGRIHIFLAVLFCVPTNLRILQSNRYTINAGLSPLAFDTALVLF